MLAHLLNSLVPLLLTASNAMNAPQTTATELQAIIIEKADAEIALKSQLFLNIFSGEGFDWSVDLNEGMIKFTSATKTVSAPVQVVGTYNTLDGTFLWGWDHPSVPTLLGADARLAHEFGQRQKLPMFMTRKVKCTEEQAWKFTAVALHLSGGQGAYRGPAGTTMVFMTFGDMTITPNK